MIGIGTKTNEYIPDVVRDIRAYAARKCHIHPVSPWFRSREKAVAAWNRRTGEEETK